MFFKNKQQGNANKLLSSTKDLFIKYKTYLFIVLLTMIGLYFRCLDLNKPNGFWYDEAYCCYDAEASFPFGIFNRVLHQDLHSPLYFFILHFWMKIYGHEDVAVRFLSLLFGVLLIPVLYFAGKELGSKKAGIITAALASVNSLLIYYSQEVKFYSLLTLLSGLSALFLLKIKNSSKKKYLAGLVITNLALLYTFPLCTIFVFFEALIFIIYLCFTKKSIKNFIIAQIITLALYLPYLSLFFQSHAGSSTSKAIMGQFWWSQFSPVVLLYIIQDWFSFNPINLCTNPLGFYNMLFASGSIIKIITLLFIPVIIYLIGIIRALKEKNFTWILFLVGFSFLIAEIILTLQGRLALITRYTLLILPIMILLAGYGLSKLRYKMTSSVLVSIFIILSIFYLQFSQDSTPHWIRSEGLKTVGDILDRYPLDKNDLIIMPHAGLILYRYFDKSKLLDFDYNSAFLAANPNLLNKIFPPNLLNFLNKGSSRPLLRGYLASPYPTSTLENYIEKGVINKVPHGRYIVVVRSMNISSYNAPTMGRIVNNDAAYNQIPLFILLCSKVSNDISSICNEYLISVDKVHEDVWDVEIYKKP